MSTWKWCVVAWLTFNAGFLAGCWFVVSRQDRAHQDARQHARTLQRLTAVPGYKETSNN